MIVGNGIVWENGSVKTLIIFQMPGIQELVKNSDGTYA